MTLCHAAINQSLVYCTFKAIALNNTCTEVLNIELGVECRVMLCTDPF